jgi:HK97 family phage major capsid protein
MPGIKQLEEQGRALLEDQKRLVLEDERPWSEKSEEFEKLDADIKAVIAQHGAAKQTDPFTAKLTDNIPVQKTIVSLGEQFTESTDYKTTIATAKGSRFSASAELKVAGSITEAGTGVGGVVPQYTPGVVPTLFRRLTVADLLPQGQMSSPTLIYVQETAVTNNAATVAEGALKPLSDITLAQVTEVARKIATLGKISDEMLQDVNYIQSYLNGRLTLFVQLAEEDQILNGNGTPPNLTGLMNRSGLTAAQAKGSDPALDAIYKEITKIRLGSFLEPDGIVLHPTDWQSIRLSKDSNGQYYGGGPFQFGPYGNGSFGGGSETNMLTAGSEKLWGTRVIVTPAIAQGTALVGAFSTSAQLWRRSGLTVEMSNSNNDDFEKNMVTVRVEERVALEVARPAGFGKVTGL